MNLQDNQSTVRTLDEGIKPSKTAALTVEIRYPLRTDRQANNQARDPESSDDSGKDRSEFGRAGLGDERDDHYVVDSQNETR